MYKGNKKKVEVNTMGLDMYLWREIYVGAEYTHRGVTGSIELNYQGTRLPVNFKKVSTITEEAMYWRKANAIHNWFVENVQDGQDDCRKYWVDIDKLIELRKTIKKVLQNHKLASELLPTSVGFFFGETDYDSYYYESLEETEKELFQIIKDYKRLTDKQRADVNFYYESSW